MAWLTCPQASLMLLGLMSVSLYVYHALPAYTWSRVSTVSRDWTVSVHCGNEERKRHVMQICRKRGRGKEVSRSSRLTYSWFLVDDKQKMLYCVIPKAASTTTKSLLLLGPGRITRTALEKDRYQIHEGLVPWNGFYWLKTLPLTNITWKYHNYYKFIVTRDPLQRFYSAWVDKFRDNSAYPDIYSNVIFHAYPNVSTSSKGIPQVTFQQFMSLVVRNLIPDTEQHWNKQVNHCHPCLLQFDYIAKFETYEEDMKRFLLPRVNVSDIPHFMKGGEGFNRSSIPVAPLVEMMNTIPGSLRRQFYAHYREDYRLFGYSWDGGRGGPANCVMTNDGRSCC